MMTHFEAGTTPVKKSGKFSRGMMTHFEAGTTPVKKSGKFSRGMMTHFEAGTTPVKKSGNFSRGIMTHFEAGTTPVKKSLPDDVRFRPPVGNGHIATNVFSDTVYMNGLYNGREDESSRARIPAYVNVDVNVTQEQIISSKYTLDMYNGFFIKELNTPTVQITITVFAHRALSRLLVTQLRVKRRTSVPGNITLYLLNNKGDDSDDFNWQKEEHLQGFSRSTVYQTGTVKEMELPDATPSVLHVFYTPIPPTLVLHERQDTVTANFYASHSVNRTDALDSYLQGGQDDLLFKHTKSWNSLWAEGRVDVQGNKGLSQIITAATYNILCSLPASDDQIIPFYGLSPGGLSRGGRTNPARPGGGENDYAGHVFWDMDTWIMPPIMLFHPDMALRMLQSRFRVMDQAKENARISGLSGVKFPWEQAATGIEATPKWAGNMSRFEIHITADIAYGLRQYLYVTEDVSFLLEDRGLELAIESARFWQHRVTETDNGDIQILGVMGPDEYHFNINNSAFTNYNAKLNLLLPQYIVNNFNITVNKSVAEDIKEFATVAGRIYIPFNETMQFHPQYDGFDITAPIKQSDVVLLGYPLMMPMSSEVRRNDLELYEKITDAQGPDTGTWSMHTVGWLELGDESRAYKNFQMMFRNINEPFKVFSEHPVTNTSRGGCVNFITGAGGLLQSVVFGYGGLRMRENRLDINPKLLPNLTTWDLIGIHYRGALIDITITEDKVELKAGKIPSNRNVLVNISQTKERHLQENEIFTFNRQLASVRVVVFDSQPATVQAKSDPALNSVTSTFTAATTTTTTEAVNDRSSSAGKELMFNSAAFQVNVLIVFFFVLHEII